MNRVKCQWYIAILIVLSATSFSTSGFAADVAPGPPTQVKVFSPDSVPPPVPPPGPPPGNDSLLVGKTPANYAVPSGWTIVRTQDFENGCPGDESCGRFNGSITSEKPHTGSKSVGGTYATDQADVGWTLMDGVTGSFSDIYLSFYEYIESQARFNDEFFLARFAVWGNGPPNQELLIDWYWAPGFNKPNATLYAVSQGSVEGRFAGKGSTIPTGSWVQWEIWYRPNSVGSSNGFISVYLNGRLFTSAGNVELNGRNMNNCEIQAGGVYTKLVWMTDYPACTQCSSGPGEGTDYCTGAQGWWGQSFSNPKCGPSLPSFKRFIDDIIVMKK